MDSPSRSVYGYQQSSGVRSMAIGDGRMVIFGGVGMMLFGALEAFVFQHFEFLGLGFGMGLAGVILKGIGPYKWWLIMKNEHILIENGDLSYFDLRGRELFTCPLADFRFIRKEARFGQRWPAEYFFSTGKCRFRVLACIENADELFAKLGAVAPSYEDKGIFL